MSEGRRGFLFGVAAYALWGLFPLYWPLLEPAGAIEILAHRVVWSLVAVGTLTVVLRQARSVRAIFARRRSLVLLTVGAAVIAVNWGTYIWGVNNHRVVETSLGYFINPLVTVLMGVVILKERLRPWQWGAIGIATAAVVGLAVEYGHPPWVALVLAFSFGTYGLAKKTAGVGAIPSLTYETLALTPVALAYLLFLGADGEGHFTTDGAGHALLLASAGVVTAVPLLCFGAAAIRVSLTTIGLLQYLAPILQFLLGVAVLHEQMTTMRWVGFVAVWVALMIFTFEALHHRRQQLRLAVEASAV
ncbi:MAG TPA: EamA family transporter RarD [Marmoricola sp.]|nr:EamA family transporter RarD [Marmoricola sp.]